MVGEKIRREDRFRYAIPEFVYVEFKIKEESSPAGAKVYDLKVLDGSNHGLGVLVTQKDFELLRVLNSGDSIQGVTFFSTWTVITVNGTVKHMTEIQEGKYKGCYLLGIESRDLIENCKPPTCD